MEHRIEVGMDQGFLSRYEGYMLEKCGGEDLPNPHRARHGVFHNYRPWEYEKVFRYGGFGPGDVVLDTGAMHTYFCIFVAQFVQRLVASDNFYWAGREYMETQKLLSPEQWMEFVERRGDGKIRGENADLMNLPYPDESFDKILSISTIEHVLDDTRAMGEMARVLKKGGKLLLTTEFNFHHGKKYSEKDGSYLRIYDRKMLGKLVSSAGLKPCTPFTMEMKNFFLLRRKVNVFVGLTK